MGSPSLRDFHLNSLIKVPSDLVPRSAREIKKVFLKLRTEIRRMETENELYRDFLIANDEEYIDPVTFQELMSSLVGLLKNQDSDHGIETEKTFQRKRYSNSLSSLQIQELLPIGPRINFVKKTDLAIRETESVSKELNQFDKDCSGKIKNYSAEIEGYEFTNQGILKTREQFERLILESIDPVAHRIPAEIFVNFMMDWQRRAVPTMEKLRIKVNNQKVEFEKLKTRLVKISTLRKNVDETTIYKLTIDKKNLKEELKSKSKLFEEMSRAASKIRQHDRDTKSKISELMRKKEGLLENITKVQNITEKIEKEGDELWEKNEKMRKKREFIRYRVTKTELPTVDQYIKVKSQLRNLQLRKKRLIQRSQTQKGVLRCTINLFKEQRRHMPEQFRTSFKARDLLVPLTESQCTFTYGHPSECSIWTVGMFFK